MRTPHIQKLKTSGGTLYTFSSANNDLMSMMTNSNVEFSFSKFVCVNLPDLYADVDSDERLEKNYTFVIKYPKRDRYATVPYDTSTQDGVNDMLARNIQNYILNFESYMLNIDSTDVFEKSTSEAILFNWLEKVNAIEFGAITDDDKYVSNGLLDLNEDTYYKEIRHTSESTEEMPNDDTFVKYLGAIDIINKNDKAGDSYTQLYMHIPSEAGCTPKIIFKDDLTHSKRKDDGTYNVRTDSSTTDPGYIIGSRSSSSSVIGSNTAFYDGEDTTAEYDGAYEMDKFIGIDFNASDYYDITSNAKINSINDYNLSADSHAFEFNAILIYYDLYDKSRNETVTNLYGILFLDNVQWQNEEGVVGYIQRYPKYKTSIIDKYNGNSFGIKLDLKIDINTGTGDSYSISDESTLTGLNMFSDAMRELQKASSLFMSLEKQYNEISGRFRQYENIILALTNENQQLKNELDTINKQIVGYTAGLGIDISVVDNKYQISSTDSYDNVTVLDVALISSEEEVSEDYGYTVNLGYGTDTVSCNVLTDDGDYLAFKFNSDEYPIHTGKNIVVIFSRKIEATVNMQIGGTMISAMLDGKDHFTVKCIDVEAGEYKVLI